MAAALLLAVATATSSAHEPAARTATDSLGRTTVQESIQPSGSGAYRSLVRGPGWSRLVRLVKPAAAIPQRSDRRRSLAYFAQLTDFQLADEESPARVEFTDFDPSGTAASAWRPQEGLHPFAIDYSMRQLNRFVPASPIPQAGGRRARMDFGLLTGDNSDNQQFNETVWVRQLIEGGQPLNPNSGVSNYSTCTPADQAALATKPANEAQRYTGVQDYSDYGGSTDFYDPNQPQGQWAAWPRYPGLMDRAQAPFVPEGLNVLTYITNGNHDGLVQGNEDAIKAYEDVAIGCFKPFSTSVAPGLADPNLLIGMTTGFAVPPDGGRRFVDRVELKRIYRQGTQGDGHGFNFIDKGQLAASGFSATYYAWDAKPGMRFVSIDTVSEGGVAGVTDRGNVDDPQFRWLEGELQRASAQDKVVVVFGHHPVRSLTSNIPDENASPCTGSYSSEGNTYSGAKGAGGQHDVNPGCDLDPRDSSPLHGGSDLVSLLSKYPHVLAYVAGHTHENRLLACGLPGGCPGKGSWWEINTSATADWPQQHRLVEVMDNRDGTLSLFGTVLNHGGRLDLPGTNTNAAGFTDQVLAGLGLTFSYNDPAADKAGPGKPNGAEGAPQDRNVELLVKDPRRSSAALARRLGRCAVPTGRMRGKYVDRARLGRTRRRTRRSFPRRSLKRQGRYMDRFCLAGGGNLRVGYPSARVRRRLSRRERRRVKERAVLVLTSSKLYRSRRVRTGTTTRTLRRRIGRRRVLSTRIGKNRWYLRRGRSVTLVFKVRRGRVREVGLADRRLTRTRARARRLLKSYRG